MKSAEDLFESNTDSEISVSIKLDARQAKKDGTFPVKLCIYHKPTRKAKYYSTIFSFTQDEFRSIWMTNKPRNIYKPTIDKLGRLITKAEADLKGLEPFSFGAYEVKLKRKSSDGENIFWHYERRIGELRDLKSMGTADWYAYSMNSIKKYLENLKDRMDRLAFEKVTPNWLLHYEKYMLGCGKSKTTIAMYLRALMAIFHQAVKSKDIEKSIVPFGDGKYVVKEGGKVKKALSFSQLQKLFNSDPLTQEQGIAKDFWFFSYFNNGMNIKDILALRYGQFGLDESGKQYFTFERTKTKNKDKESRIIKVYLNEFTKMVISNPEYINKRNGNPKQLLFNVVSEQDGPSGQYFMTKSFTRKVNQHIKKLAIANGLPADISTYFARHTFATGLQRGGTSISYIQEALGHSDIATTQKYMAGFEDEEKKEVADKMYHNLIS